MQQQITQSSSQQKQRLVTWEVLNYDPSVVESLSRELGLEHLQALLLSHRHTTNPQQWLDARIRDYAPNPLALPDINQLATHIQHANTIGILSDYDVDGVMSAVIWREFLTAINKRAIVRIPLRSNGYGINSHDTLLLEQAGAECLLFLDCGTDQGHKVHQTQLPQLVIDHHVVKTDRNNFDAFVNPYRHTHTAAGFTQLCTATLSLLAIAALTRLSGRKFDYLELFDLAAIGTIADVMPLVGFNRALTKSGLTRINLKPRPPIHALLFSKYTKKVTAQDVAYVLAPKINAAGRLADANLALELFNPNITHDELTNKANAIETLNNKRKMIERAVLEEAEAIIQEYNAGADASTTQLPQLVLPSIIVLVRADWHHGVLGIVASRLKEKYHRPIFLLTELDGALKGSARSAHLDLGVLIKNAIAAGVITEGGGHQAAAGLSLTHQQLAPFYNFLRETPMQPAQSLLIDTETTIGALRKTDFEILEPFGQSNPVPRFLLQDVRIASYQMLQDVHARITLADSTHQIVVMYFHANTQLLQKDKKVSVVLRYTSSDYHVIDWCEFKRVDIL
jgi:single-stranded-DNA-specific exonuclease